MISFKLKIIGYGALLRCRSGWDLSYTDMHGQCYDGSTNMPGAKMDTNLLYRSMHQRLHNCAAHRLNLAILSACNIQTFKSMEGCIGEI